jgi:hypothetical protein
METHPKAPSGIITGSGVVHATRQPLIQLDYRPQCEYRNVVIRADKENAGMLYIDGDNSGKRISLSPSQEAQIEVSDIHNIHVVGDGEETEYDWIAL